MGRPTMAEAGEGSLDLAQPGRWAVRHSLRSREAIAAPSLPRDGGDSRYYEQTGVGLLEWAPERWEIQQ
jgi:hypothetical protein